jgi:pyruvate dehydrogenase E2 component (dihydrolipoamide acetyltransferase)
MMPIPVTIPRLGWNMEEGTFVEWLKADGDAIRPGDVVFRLEGEKATEEIESLDAGTLHIPADGPKPGDRIKVGAVIGYLLQPGESVPECPNELPGERPGFTPPG